MTELSFITGKSDTATEKSGTQEVDCEKQKKRRGKKLSAWVVVVLVILVAAMGTILVYGSYRLSCRYLGSSSPTTNGTASAAMGSEQMETLQTEPFTFDDIFDPLLRPRSFSIRWMGDTLFTHRNSSTGDLMEYNAVDDTQVVLMPNRIFEEENVATYFVSDDRQRVLISYEYEKLWRYSFSARYKIYIRGAAPGEDLVDFPQGDLSGARLQYAGWAPVATAQKLAFVHENDLYYQESPTTDYVRVTTTGTEDIFNGHSDWVYEEDVTGSPSAIYWSKDASRFCFASFDVTEIPKVSWPWYGPKSDVYGQIRDVKIPKAGYTPDGNPGPITKVSLYVVDVADVEASNRPLLPPTELASEDHLYTRVAWRDDDHVMVTWSNRVQNYSIVDLCDTAPLPIPCQRHYELERSDGWIDTPWGNPRFVDNGDNYLTILSRDVDDQGGFRHPARVTSPLAGNGVTTFLTGGVEEVTSIVGFDQTRQLVYYITTNGEPLDRRLFRVGTPEADEEDRDPVCMTCDEPAESCDYASAYFSADSSYYLLSCLGPAIRTYHLRSADGSKDLVMEDNADVQARLDVKDLPTREFMDLDLGNGIAGKAEIFVPHTSGEGRQYPMLVYAYAGPGTQRVSKSYPMGSNTLNWLRYLASSEGILVASIDGRGASGRGDRMRFQGYRKLGTVEVTDQIEGARLLKETAHVDESEEAAIFGWSYGGYAASHALPDDANQYQCAAAVAPAISFSFYDTAYTERYMGLATADDNAGGYDDADATNKAEKYAGKKYLVAHGSADDNVQYMHAAHLINRLTQLEIQFTNLLYIDQDHGISRDSRHLYQAMTDFLLDDCWEGRHP